MVFFPLPGVTVTPYHTPSRHHSGWKSPKSRIFRFPKNRQNWPYLAFFDELLSTQIVNISRFARNVEWDFFSDFQPLCILEDDFGSAGKNWNKSGSLLKTSQYWNELANRTSNWTTQCLKITEKVAFNIASEASYVYILSGQKLIQNAQKLSICEIDSMCLQLQFSRPRWR